MSLNVSAKEVHQRLKAKHCLNCGQPQTNTELNSCNNKDCVKALRPLYRDIRNLLNRVYSRVSLTYVLYPGR